MRENFSFDHGSALAGEPDLNGLKLPSGYVLRHVDDLGRVEVAALALSAVSEMCSAVANAGGLGSGLHEVNANNLACLLDLIMREIKEPATL
ncbi:hypothetical protein [Novosphingobium sp.]|uniref:hypothetical protein n=1 Tax=Novosphingobium sp. TaxID=1874826 RepID=UPI0035629890